MSIDEEDGSTSLDPEPMEISNTSEWEDMNSQYHQESSMETSQGDDVANEFPLAENILKVEVDFNEKVGKKSNNLPNTGISDVLDAEFALRNTNGGVIKLQMKTSLSPEKRMKKIDEWKLNLNRERDERLKILGKKEAFDEIVDYRIEDLMIIFVKKSSIILTEKSNLYMRGDTARYSPKCFSEIQNVLQKNRPNCCCKYRQPVNVFQLDNRMPFGESVTVEYKHLTAKDFPDKLCKELKEYIAPFANTAGGDVYFGITDATIIMGQHVDDKEAIKHKIELCVKSKIWFNECGKEDTHVNGRLEVDFFPVDGADEQTFVIRVHICQYAGVVFHKDSEPECKIVTEENQIIKMTSESWLSSFLKTDTTEDNNWCNYREDKFEKQKLGNFTYCSLKSTVPKLVHDLASGYPGPLKLQPSHAVEWIKHSSLKILVEKTKNFFKKCKKSGIVYIERCWEVNLGLRSTKPDDVICDVLICCPQLPLVFVSLTKSDTPDETSHSYNKKVASKIKATLVQKANCLEKFYVKAVVTSLQQLNSENVSSIYSEIPLYPKTYCMSTDKYSKILETLVLVLARANVKASHDVGEDFFYLLTHEQYKILHEDFENCQKVKISGPPGSGKTVLALERIQRLRNMGCSYDNVLFLCSNKPQEAMVKNIKTPNGEPLCIVKTYHELASNGGFDDLHEIEHILADETQNFQEANTSQSWWNELLDLCNKVEDSSFWVFLDLSQKINNNRPVSLRSFPGRQLKTIIRQTGNVHRFICTHKYMNVEPSVALGHDFDGQEVDVLVPSGNAFSSPVYLIDILISQLKKLIFDDGHHVKEIAVLFHDNQQQKHYKELFIGQSNRPCQIRNGEEVETNGVVFDTIRRYSGMDANIVIGFCPQKCDSDSQNDDALMTALCSRTKFKLILIFESEQHAKSFKLDSAELKKVTFK